MRGWATLAFFLHEGLSGGDQGPKVPFVRVGSNSAIGPTKKKKIHSSIWEPPFRPGLIGRFAGTMNTFSVRTLVLSLFG